ncbi:unnamed protein product [Ectocarpus sp. CCAP 1310/34]|nr:unnamed protein product [Ectocarpus sp. CCAP 1310/34]
MANATGGVKHASKAAGPRKWVREHCADGFADDPFFDADAHGVDLPVSIHQGVHPEYLEKGTAGIIDYFKRQLLSKWLQSTELFLVCYDRQELVPVIKGQEQLGRTEKLGECSRTFDPKSTGPVPSLQYGPWLRADGKAARDGIAAYLAMRVLADEVWTGDTNPNGIVAFYCVGSEPGLSADHPTVDAEGVGLEMGGVGATEALSGTEPLLHFRKGNDHTPGVKRQRGPDIGEAELSWTVSSVDTDLWMTILLAMATGWLRPRGEGAVDVTVQKVVGGETKFLWMNRVFASICELQDGSESAWPLLTFRGWIPTDNKVRLFVLTFLDLGCDYLPAISGLPFDKMWVLALKSVRTEGLFDKPLFFEEQDGMWAVHVDECAKLLATMFFYKVEAAFGTAHLAPPQLVESVDGDVEGYVDVTRYAILELPKKQTTATCPSSFSLRKQAERDNAIFRYWQNGLRGTMPATEFAGKGWSLDPRGKGSDGDELTKENCVLDLSDHLSIFFSLRKQAERGNAIFRYWQNGLREAMPATEFAGKGWSVDPRGKGSEGDELTKENCVLDLSECTNKKCSLACGCRNRCTPTAGGAGTRACKGEESHGAEQNDVEAGTPESPASKGVSAGEAAESKSAELEDLESNENDDGSVGALDDLINLDSGKSGSSDGEPNGVSEKSVYSNWSDGDTDDGVADLVIDARN